MELNNEQIFTCEEHVDIAFDDFLSINETFPVFNETRSVTCSYCNKPALYVLKISE